MEHAQREAALHAGDLIVIELHGIDGPAVEFVVLRVRPEDRAQQDASVTFLWMNTHRIPVGAYPSAEFFAVISQIHYRTITCDQNRPLRTRSSATDRKSTRLNSSHVRISYAVFCLKKKNKTRTDGHQRVVLHEVVLVECPY